MGEGGVRCEGESAEGYCKGDDRGRQSEGMGERGAWPGVEDGPTRRTWSTSVLTWQGCLLGVDCMSLLALSGVSYMILSANSGLGISRGLAVRQLMPLSSYLEASVCTNAMRV